jgi:hypothetical protein
MEQSDLSHRTHTYTSRAPQTFVAAVAAAVGVTIVVLGAGSVEGTLGTFMIVTGALFAFVGGLSFAALASFKVSFAENDLYLRSLTNGAHSIRYADVTGIEERQSELRIRYKDEKGQEELLTIPQLGDARAWRKELEERTETPISD